MVRLRWQFVCVSLLLLGTSGTLHASTLNATALTPEEWRAALLELRLDPDAIPNPIAYSDDIREASLAAISGAETTLEKLDLIQKYLFDESNAFTYDFVGTLTAEQAFQTRQGNCVAFTNLFISMARAADIPVHAALVSAKGGEEKTLEDLSLVKNHIVAVYRHSYGATVYDFYTARTGVPITIKPIDDLWSAAIYVNNLGVKALSENDLELALVRFNIALRLAPIYAPVYGNAGVTRRRMGDTEGAFDYYLLALLIEPRNASIRKNLMVTLEEIAQTATGAAIDAGASAARGDAAGLLSRAAGRLAGGDVRGARTLIRRAIRKAPDWVNPLVSMARCELLSGRPTSAENFLKEALELDPEQPSAQRLSGAMARILPTKGRRPRNKDNEVDPQPSWNPDGKDAAATDSGVQIRR